MKKTVFTVSCLLFGFSKHKGSYEVDADLVRKRPQCLIGFGQFFPDRDGLRTVAFAFAAFDAFTGEGRVLIQSDGLGVLETAVVFGFGIHAVVGIEGSRDIDAFDARHAIVAACASHFLVGFDGCNDFPDQGEILLGEGIGFRLRGDAAVFLDHLK